MNNNNNTEAIIKKLPKRMQEAFKLDEHNHFKLSAEEMELQEVIDTACEEMRVETGEIIPLFKRVWLRKDISDHLAKKYGEPVITKDFVTEKDKFDFIMEKIIWESRKIRRISNGNPFKDWADMERKAREVLNRFGQDLPGKVKIELLVTCAAMFFIGITSWAKWDKSSEKAEVKRQK